ncbi:ANTAR domain-containing protein [Blastococcus sp. URHD0036]|uniref:ANTAR domain-containing protein n=1 Tax=Blastococcus sp. URHD0036 TaxID=1380356 RepID=UPI00068BEAB8|nr:ANTAR domain-containing protein [Blastococcus sp. URHD0036]
MSKPEHPAGAPACCPDPAAAEAPALPQVTVVRTARGWSVVSPGAAADVHDLLEGLSLADLLAEAAGTAPQPDATARRAARGPAPADAGPEADPRDARVAELERTVAQLEHALAARVATERAIGVLAERHGTTPRSAFELLRGQARSTGRPVHELARAVLEPLDRRPAVPLTTVAPSPGPVAPVDAPLPPAPRAAGSRRARSRAGAVVAGDDRS